MKVNVIVAPEKNSFLLEIEYGATMAEIEKAVINAMLIRRNNNRTQVARDLHIGIRTVFRRIQRWKSEDRAPGAQNPVL